MNKREQGKAATRALILETAAKAFEERSVDAVTTREIAQRAGVGVGTLFAHFPDKVSLVEALLVDKIDAALDRAAQSLPETDIVSQLVHVARELYATYAQHPALSRALVTNALFLAGEERPTTAQLVRFRGWVMRRLAEAHARGEIAGSTEQDFFVFFALYFGVLVGGLRGEIPLEAQPAALEGALRRWFGGKP